MGHTLRLLLDDRAFVEIGGDVMRRGADDLHAPLVGLMIGLGALEARQEGVMNVDDAAEEGRREAIGENLHVAGQDHEFGAGLVDEFDDLLLLLGLVVPGDGPQMERQSGLFGRSPRILVVRHDGGDVGRSQPTRS